MYSPVVSNYRRLEDQPAVVEPQPSNTSRKSILAGLGTLAGAFTTAAGISMLKSTTATVVTAGGVFTALGAVTTVALGILFYKFRNAQQ